MALEMRKTGMSYNDIRARLHLSKSTLSRWLQNIPLSPEAINKLNSSKQMKVERYRNTMKEKRERKLNIYYESEKKYISPLSSKELYLAGLFLYWGEGSKTVRHTVSINNTDPTVLQFVLLWFAQSLKIPKNKIKVMLHLYSDMDINKEKDFWSKILHIPLNQFLKPYVKQTLKSGLDQRGFGHGTCGLMVYDTKLKEKILMALKFVSDQSQKEIPFF